jgi:hypothetical protein
MIIILENFIILPDCKHSKTEKMPLLMALKLN